MCTATPQSASARCCLVNMIVGGGYFEGSHDHNLMPGSLIKPDFANERQRREWMNVAFWALRILLPDPKDDRVSNVEDAIEYIHELNRTVKELKILVEQKRHGTNRKKMIKMDEEAASDGENSSTMPVRDEQDNELDWAIRSSWVQRRSQECRVDVHIVENAVNVQLTEWKNANSLPHAAKVLDEFHLEIISVVGQIVGDHRIFIFNTKVSEGCSVYALAVAERLFQAVDAQHQALNILGQALATKLTI
ncbi:hypothetical protein CFC21_018785 [Triticum aestivum]|uniref:BHLH domain-containing protein n=4 Tax=Triticum TaxID=4564 RepID=A0A9R1P4E9_TRITD|nr:transcription factor EAT1-like isoform X2 [Triticum dicoccoides]KAF7003475.1 hypothetical protein CFC21_018785 [Triticum aestivum]VAH36324.1 unnamed protein product [Triticum turgidum subsp. durum]